MKQMSINQSGAAPELIMIGLRAFPRVWHRLHDLVRAVSSDMCLSYI